jgi:hypothetical protein
MDDGFKRRNCCVSGLPNGAKETIGDIFLSLYIVPCRVCGERDLGGRRQAICVVDRNQKLGCEDFLWRTKIYVSYKLDSCTGVGLGNQARTKLSFSRNPTGFGERRACGLRSGVLLADLAPGVVAYGSGRFRWKGLFQSPHGHIVDAVEQQPLQIVAVDTLKIGINK